jgi:porphobilinogen synthase
MMHRPRRNRATAAIRDMVRETSVSLSHLIYPMFVYEGAGLPIPIPSMPGIFRWSQADIAKEVAACVELGILNFVIFPAFPEEKKDANATLSYHSDNFYLHVIADLKQRFPHIVLMSDVAMDPYSSDGHDGLVRDGQIVNDETLVILAKMAVAQAQAGIDIVGPSDMMDGRVGFIRNALDHSGYHGVSIMSYTAKYASAYYGPFRDALESAPKKGDKKTYQMDPANKTEALRELYLDLEEGADMVMVKPALCYLDVIHALKEQSTVPVAAYNVSGEYAMIKAAAQNGWLDEERCMLEMLTSIKRAGADIILTYFAKQFALAVR